MRCLPLLLLLPLGACAEPASNLTDSSTPVTNETAPNEPSEMSGAPAPDSSGASDETAAETPRATTEIATLGAGCYWCVEAVLEQLDGVLDVTSGFMGGQVENPSYKAVCTGSTGHAEVVQVTFDPAKISYDDVLKWFWKLHDPTTLNRQGGDVGTQYRSAIFVHSDAQRKAAEASKQAAQADFKDPIVTEITPAAEYYEAEDYHQDYYVNNRSQGYCRAVIAPKLGKLGLEK